MEMSEQKSRSRYWRSLNELHQTPEFEQHLQREFPVAASEYPSGISRRRWVQLMGASLTLSGMAGCRYSEEIIAPFVVRPEGRVPGESYQYATNFEWADRVYHVLVEGVDGRPLKVEGYKDHPSARGGTDVYSQAAILNLYDPDRKEGIARRENGELREIENSDELFTYLKGVSVDLKAAAGRGLGVLIGPTYSPAVIGLLKELRDAYPQAVIAQYDSVRGDVVRKGVAQAVGFEGDPIYELDKANVIVSVGADLLGADRSFVRNANRFIQGRAPVHGKMNRLYVFESQFSNTGMNADTRVALAPSELVALLGELERRIDAGAGNAAAAADEKPYDTLSPADKLARVLDVLAAELVASKGASLIAVGEQLGAEAFAAGVRINSKLENLGKTLQFSKALEADLGPLVDLKTFADKASEFTTVFILASNPVYTAPADIDLGKALQGVKDSFYWTEYDDETAEYVNWIVPAAHPLESWGDVVSIDGVYGVCQPQILPLLGGLTRIELLAQFLGRSVTDPQAIVRESAGRIAGGALNEARWRKLLHDGYADDVKLPLQPAQYTGAATAPAGAAPKANVADDVKADALEVVFIPGEGVYDGRFANNGWLQELPNTLTKLTWDNVAIISPSTAKKLGTKQGGLIDLAIGEGSVTLPVYEMPGVAHGVVVVQYGYGRTRAGAVGGHVDLKADIVGVDVRPIRSSTTMMWAAGAKATVKSGAFRLGITQDHFAIDTGGLDETKDRAGRLIREGTLEKYHKDPEFTAHLGTHKPDMKSLWEEPMDMIEADPKLGKLPQWGMAIDLTKCVGCNACVVACQAENNVPIVGKEQVIRSREMHWLRLDRYYVGDENDPQMVSEPVACMHCETAPCEQVCPVAATVHSDEGINTMAYNRCIGTRYCANNCPYKVRRFNYFNYHTEYGYGYGWNAFPENLEKANRKLQSLVLNPDVSVRGRGVMEKCTYCIQRVERGKINARKDGGRAIADGEIQTACQTACPTNAIVFGNIKDPNSEVAKWHASDRVYGMLDHLNVQPRTQYLSRIRNPHIRLMTSVQLEKLNEEHAEHHDAEHAEEHKHDEPAAEKSAEAKAEPAEAK